MTHRLQGLSRLVHRRARRGFSMIDVLVSMAVIALLMGLLLPSLAIVRETARRVVCASNVRQIGLGLAMYGDDFREFLPPTAYLHVATGPKWEQMMVLRMTPLEGPTYQTNSAYWDGLGMLFWHDYLNAPRIFYCPSHKGEHPYERYTSVLNRNANPLNADIVGNYQYRGVGPNGSNRLWRIEPSFSALATDGLRSVDDFSHRTGANVLRADLSLFWYSDTGGLMTANFERMGAASSGDERSNAVYDAWEILDGGSAASSGDPGN
ncbi:MAG: DUF1559 domain-containing protein [Phycisphaeraceae bacterium]|nr:DUF1559 domain-containing protein [Phycisphaeraceae bacterium]